MDYNEILNNLTDARIVRRAKSEQETRDLWVDIEASGRIAAAAVTSKNAGAIELLLARYLGKQVDLVDPCSTDHKMVYQIAKWLGNEYLIGDHVKYYGYIKRECS
jgi:hypothetical protein